MEGLGLRSGEDNAPTGGHREGELDLPVISTGSGARKDEVRRINEDVDEKDLMVKHRILRSGAIVLGLK
jgi:hypothetical protein